MRVLASPAYENQDLNLYNRLLYEHLEPRGVTAEDWSLRPLQSGWYDLAHLHGPDPGRGHGGRERWAMLWAYSPGCGSLPCWA